MRYHNITKCDLKNGEGIRVVLWVSHCEHRCHNCHNPQTWDKDSGILFDKEAYEEIISELSKDYVSGITLSGGDPLSSVNRNDVYHLLLNIKTIFPNKNIWCYTGYKYDEVKDLEIMKYIDVLVDGKYEYKLNTPSPKWCGSSNQRIINVKESLKQNKIIIYI